MSLDLKLWLQVRQPLVEDPHDLCCSVKAVSLSFLFYVVIVRIREIPARNSAHDPSPPYRVPQKIAADKKTNSPCQHPIYLSVVTPLPRPKRQKKREPLWPTLAQPPPKYLRSARAQVFLVVPLRCATPTYVHCTYVDQRRLPALASTPSLVNVQRGVRTECPSFSSSPTHKR